MLNRKSASLNETNLHSEHELFIGSNCNVKNQHCSSVGVYLVDRISTKTKKKSVLSIVFISSALFFLLTNEKTNLHYPYLEDKKIGAIITEEIDSTLKVSWLMSFPNSGTSYTIGAAKDVSNFTMGTNYGKEKLDDDGLSMLVDDNFPHGPFRTTAHHDLPKSFILTKTHCGGFCVRCGPKDYFLSVSKFVEKCLSGSGYFYEDDTKTKIVQIKTEYDIGLVSSAIHLFRDPFDNLVSRFHFARKRYKKDPEWLEKYPKDSTGFREWCKDIRVKYGEYDELYFPEDIMNATNGVPCYADFFRYIQWHNHAWSIIRKLDIPVLILHYEEYQSKFDVSISRILDFLDLPQSGIPEKFHLSNYSDHFSSEERMAATTFMKKIASNDTMNSISRYLDLQ